MQRLDGKGAVVLGASSGSGFGAAIATRLAAAGAKVVIAGRRRAGLLALAERIDGLARVCDITEETELETLFATAREHCGGVDIAVNAAGRNHARPISKLAPAEIRAILDVHFLGTLLFIKHAAAAMIASGSGAGSIVTISSLTATLAGEGLALYGGSKAGVDHAVRVAALEYGRYGIRVNALSPGLARTPMTEAYFAEPGFADAFAKETPLGRLAAPADVAEAALWLASGQAFMTGENLQVNGGATLRRLPTAAEITGT